MPTAERPEQIRDGPRAALVSAAWSLAGATCAGGSWALTFVIARALLAPPIGPVPEGSGAQASLSYGVTGAACRFVVGILVGSAVGRQGRPSTVTLLSLGGFLTGAVGGGLTPGAVSMGAGVMSPLASSSFAWALAGSLAGFVAHAVSRWVKPGPGLEDEEPAEAAVPGATTWQPRTPRPRPSLWPVLRHFPLLAASGAALVAAAVLAPSQSAVTLLIAGILGASTAVSLINHDRRLRALERRTDA